MNRTWCLVKCRASQGEGGATEISDPPVGRWAESVLTYCLLPPPQTCLPHLCVLISCLVLPLPGVRACVCCSLSALDHGVLHPSQHQDLGIFQM